MLYKLDIPVAEPEKLESELKSVQVRAKIMYIQNLSNVVCTH